MGRMTTTIDERFERAFLACCHVIPHLAAELEPDLREMLAELPDHIDMIAVGRNGVWAVDTTSDAVQLLAAVESSEAGWLVFIRVGDRQEIV